METRQQKLVSRILDEKPERADTSLRAQAWRRARGEEPPRTMTPWEWEQWYAEHGRPEDQQKEPAAPRSGWLRRLLARLTPGS
jgi:hypothetical protein